MSNIISLIYSWSICLVLTAVNLFIIDLIMNKYFGKKFEHKLVGYFNLAPKDTQINRKYIINILGYLLSPITFLLTSLVTFLAIPACFIYIFYKVISSQIKAINEMRGSDVKNKK